MSIKAFLVRLKTWADESSLTTNLFHLPAGLISRTHSVDYYLIRPVMNHQTLCSECISPFLNLIKIKLVDEPQRFYYCCCTKYFLNPGQRRCVVHPPLEQLKATHTGKFPLWKMHKSLNPVHQGRITNERDNVGRKSAYMRLRYSLSANQAQPKCQVRRRPGLGMETVVHFRKCQWMFVTFWSNSCWKCWYTNGAVKRPNESTGTIGKVKCTSVFCEVKKREKF